MHKLRNVLTLRNLDSNWMVRSSRLVVLVQTVAKAVKLHANDGVLFLVEALRPAQRLYRDVVLLDLRGSAFEIPVAHISKQLSQAWRAVEDRGGEHMLHFGL